MNMIFRTVLYHKKHLVNKGEIEASHPNFANREYREKSPLFISEENREYRAYIYVLLQHADACL